MSLPNVDLQHGLFKTTFTTDEIFYPRYDSNLNPIIIFLAITEQLVFLFLPFQNAGQFRLIFPVRSLFHQPR